MRATALATLWAFVVTSCGGKGAAPPAPHVGSGSPLSDRALVQLETAPPGLDMRVSNGKAGPEPAHRNTIAPATALSPAETAALLARARPIQKDPDDQKAFALRPGSQPAPRTGQTIAGQFPPPPSSLLPPKGNDAGKDLRVLRWMPEGKVPLAPELSVTFSQPMIAVTSQDDATTTVPIRLTPTPKGHWRWIGTRTILFDPDVRFPQATTYTVEVPAGTKSATGNALKTATKFTFETPAPTLISSYPPATQPQHLDVPMFALFDQKIDPQAVLSSIKVTASGKAYAVRLLDLAEIAKDKQLQATVDALDKAEQQGRWLAFRTTQAFPPDASVAVDIPAGTPSAEGPNRTTKAQRFSFRTYPPFKLVRHECGGGGECPPDYPLVIEFNNPIAADRFDDKLVATNPEIPNLKVVAQYNSIVLSGATKARTTYSVTVGGNLSDDFGQKLGGDAHLVYRVTDATPTFYGPSGMVVLDPAAKKRTLDFFSTNYEQLKVKLYQVDPSQFDRYATAIENMWNHDKPPVMPGRKVFDQLVKTTVGKNTLVETRVELANALDRAGFGHAIAVVEPYPWKEDYDPPRLISWVQSTRLGVDAHVDGDQLVAFVTELDTGKPASGVALELRPFGTKAQTDERGMATIALSPASRIKGIHYLLARKGADVAFVAEHDGSYGSDQGSWVNEGRPSQIAWYVVDDRKMYKPGEEVALKGWLRTIDPGKGGDVGGIAGAVQSVTYKVRDARGNEIAKGSAPVSAVGGFDTKITLPKTPNLGYANITFETQGRTRTSYTHSVRIEEFRRPEFSVSAQASQGPFLVGGGGDVTVNAAYYAGGPLPGAPVNWYVTANPTTFTPPNRDDYTFGSWTPWWGGGRRSYFDDGDDDDGRPNRERRNWTLAAKTDVTGAHTIHFDFLSLKPAVPMALTANASVTDVNRQTWSAASALVVHPSSLYVGVRAKRPFVEQGTPFDLDVVGVDLDGKSAPGAKIEVKAVRLDWKFEKGAYKQLEVDPQTCQVTVPQHVAGQAAHDASTCTFATKEGGTYQVTAIIVDDKGRPNQTSMQFWVSGGEQPPAREVQQQQVQLIPDKKAYAPGNTAELLMQAPFYPAEGLVSWRRSGIVKTERISITGPTKVITVPIVDAMTPNLVVQVDLVGRAARTDDKGVIDPKLPRRPAYAVGTIDLAVPPKHRTLAVTVAPNAAKLAPGEAAQLAVRVTDATGRPVANAETAVLVVDEAVLALSGYRFPNPIDTFYGHRGADTRDYYSRAYVKLARPTTDTIAMTGSTGIDLQTKIAANKRPARGRAAGGKGYYKQKKGEAERGGDVDADGILDEEDSFGDDDDNDGRGAIAIRANFNPLAAFAPAVKTDARGLATVDVKLPDNLTRYRIVAIASAGDQQFGKGENAITARLPLMVRPSPPRFLNFGDRFGLPVVVQNQTDAPMTVKLAVRATNALVDNKPSGSAGRQVTVPANDRVEVLFPAGAELAGTARFQILGSAGRYSDASELALPVWTPATTEAFATYGVIDRGAVLQPVALPGKVVTEFGGLEVTTASTNLQALTDALLYLVQYPYECAEQRSSRILAIAALRDVLTAFETKDLPSPAAMEASIKTDVERLSQMQNADGGFAFWERSTDRGYPSDPYLTVYVTSALARARDKGLAPQASALIDRARPYLKTIESHYPRYYSREIRAAISAYALSTRKQLGDLDIAKGQKLLRDMGGVTKVSMETDGWLLATFAGNPAAAGERAAIVRHALDKVSETAGAANFTTGYADGNHVLLASDRRVDAVMLDALIQEQKDLDLIPKVVTGLLAHRKAGRWLNTQENTFALLAMDRYFHTYEKATPNFVARVWLGNDYAGDHAFKGRSTDHFAIAIPMTAVAAHDRQNLAIQKDGDGRLYYRVGMTYAPANLKLDPADYGFVVTRAYEPVDDPADVTRLADGTWKIKAGARVRVKLNMVNENRRYHVALVDPMPAGFEAMNPALAVTGPIPVDPKEQKSRGAYWWWYGPWYEHQNMRDERVEAFASLLWEGVHTYEYVARATTPGNFVVPPPKAEEMYMPETFGRGGSDRVIVE